MQSMELTDEEVELIRKQREKNIVKIGFLKEDLYSLNDRSEVPTIYHSKSEKEKLIIDLTNSFRLVMPAGSRFVCYIDNGTEMWHSDNKEIYASSLWAEKHLNIQNE